MSDHDHWWRKRGGRPDRASMVRALQHRIIVSQHPCTIATHPCDWEAYVEGTASLWVRGPTPAAALRALAEEMEEQDGW